MVSHLRGVAGGVTTLASGGSIELPAATGDPVADWATLRDGMLEALDQPGCLQREGETPFGHMAVDRFIGIIGVDPLCHTFDLAFAGRNPSA